MPEHNWSQIIAENGVYTDYDVPDGWYTRITFRFLRDTAGIVRQGASLLEDAGVTVTQTHAAYKAIQQPGHIPDLLHNGCVRLTEPVQFGGRSPHRLNSFMNDMRQKSDSSIRAAGIQDVQFFRDMSLAYFMVSHRYRDFGGTVEQWHVMVEKFGYKAFFELAFMGLDMDRLETFVHSDIDPNIVRELVAGVSA